jgi:hypothetical protein
MRSFCSVLSIPDIQSFHHAQPEFTGPGARFASPPRSEPEGTRCIAAALYDSDQIARGASHE